MKEKDNNINFERFLYESEDAKKLELTNAFKTYIFKGGIFVIGKTQNEYFSWQYFENYVSDAIPVEKSKNDGRLVLLPKVTGVKFDFVNGYPSISIPIKSEDGEDIQNETLIIPQSDAITFFDKNSNNEYLEDLNQLLEAVNFENVNVPDDIYED